ncbi:UvrD-helicase domain-containing protein [Agilicoccus flavus]|uniref:UvrD-helicase domain-containing protein n=1 Tax=Agilicoccus flavus TaxID=2775968 RepID=UPI001CF610E7|nr:UvrD-helicase domain-containing protein [Agilicoccus flavus]
MNRAQETTASDDLAPFAITDPLPTGTVLLEASAGTGKTWTIGALVTRYVAEGVATLDEMLVVTFGRAASQELRERVRESLTRAERALRDARSDRPGRTATAPVAEQTDAVAEPDVGPDVLAATDIVPRSDGRAARDDLARADSLFEAHDLPEPDDPAQAHDPAGGDPPEETDGLDGPSAAARADDPLVDVLLAADPAEVAARHRRLRAALGAFDAATIATTHQFCRLVLASLGVAGDTDPSARLVEDLDDLLVEVVDDLYVRGFAGSSARPAFSRDEALAIARAVHADPQARIEPAHPAPGSVAARRVGFARLVRDEMARRMRRLGVLGYDDLLSQLADALADEDAPARARMRRRWSVVLVDEFQDTDPVQWAVLDRAFSGHATMVLIGDPKQAIYAFRGGDVVTYLAAAATAGDRRTLDVDRRADAPLVDALQAMWAGARLGDEDIEVRGVRAAPNHAGGRLVGAPAGAPLRVRIAPGPPPTGRRPTQMRIGTARDIVGRDLARDVSRLLGSGATFDGRPLAAGDVAVLAHTGRQLAIAQTALRAAGISAVVAGGGSVFRTPAATTWLTVLEAMEQPHRSARVRAAALTPFVGYSAARLDAGGDDLTDSVAARMRWWAALFATRGIAAVLESATADGLPARMLAHVGGERDLTDLRHVGEALHEVGLSDSLGLVATITWLRERMTEEIVETASARTRRLDSDASAVQLSTIHGSKGLQYPVVYAPFLFDRWVSDDPPLPRFHGPDGHRCLDVGGAHPGRRDHVARALAEEAGESLRLFYVALTRAQSQVVTWWSPTTNTPPSPLHRMLLGRAPGTPDVPDAAPVPPDDRARAMFDAWRELGGPAWELVLEEPVPVRREAGGPARLELRTFGREIDPAWRRTSYTALTRVGDEEAVAGRTDGAGQVGSEPENPAREDEPEVAQIVPGAGRDAPRPWDDSGSAGTLDPSVASPASPPSPASPSRSAESAESSESSPPAATVGAAAEAVASPMADLPVGATFGSLVHQVLEEADATSPRLREELTDRIHEAILRWPVDLDRSALAEALAAVVRTPLGPLAPGVTLADVGRRDRLCEMEFEMPLVGGDLARAGAPVVRLAALAEPLRRHLPPGDPVRAYADVLEAGAMGEQELRGYLTGSLDVVLRVGERYLVADYKTNWLGPIDEPLTAHTYRPAALAEAMGHSSYPLQALLYAVVLHRYLRWRVRDYDPERHLGGVLYLYVRGMCGPDTPVVDGQPCGVFSWRPPAALVLECSDVFDGPGGVL